MTTTFPLLSTPLLSCAEVVNLCQGDCGDEIEVGQELCVSCRRDEDRYYAEKQRKKERHEELLSKSQYQHLK